MNFDISKFEHFMTMEMKMKQFSILLHHYEKINKTHLDPKN